MMASLFALFVVELWMNNKMGGHSHSHGGALGFEAPAPTTTTVSVARPDSSSTESTTPTEGGVDMTKDKDNQVVVSETEMWTDAEGQPVDPLVYKKMNSKYTLGSLPPSVSGKMTNHRSEHRITRRRYPFPLGFRGHYGLYHDRRIYSLAYRHFISPSVRGPRVGLANRGRTISPRE